MYLNCQGYLNNKDGINSLINQWRPKIVFLSETHVCAEVTLRELDIEGYRIEKCTTDNRRTGGVMALIRKDVRCTLRSVECVQNFVWLLSVEFSNFGIKYLCTVLYHPPKKEDAQFLEFFVGYLDRVSAFDGIILIFGDFNLDLLKHSFYGDKILHSISSSGFTQIVTSPTRITDRSQTLIDYIVTNNRHLQHAVHLAPRIGDHCILSVDLGRDRVEGNRVNVCRRSFKGYDTSKLQDYFFDVPWNSNISDVNLLADVFVNDIKNIIDSMCPVLEITYSQKYEDKKWITDDIKQKMSERDALYVRAVRERNDDVWKEYKSMRNLIVSKIKFEKDEFFKRTIDDNKHNPKELWKNLKLLLPERKNSVIGEVKFGDVAVTNNLIIANKFNEYFISSIADIIAGMPACPFQNIHGNIFSSSLNPDGVFSRFNPVTMSELKITLKNLKNVGGGESNISKKVLCDVCDVAGNRLLDIINSSLTAGVFPHAWKESIIIPVPKVQNTRVHTEFRPINTVELYEKVLELVVKAQLQLHCDKNNILIPNQSGFREKHSCESVLVSVCDSFINSIDSGNFVLAVFLDLKRAFETVSRSILLQKLSNVGLKHVVLRWFESYLNDRRQKVKLNNSMSDSLPVEYGVPQGTVLGPLLFLLYINDIVGVVENCGVELFADDTMIYISGTNLMQMQQKVNQDLEHLFHWLCKNNLSINTAKTKFCIFGRKCKLNSFNIDEIDLKMNGHSISYEQNIKYLGVIFDPCLTFHAHADYTLRKYAKKVNFISRVGKNLSLYTKLLLYNSIASPHLQFCSTLLYGLPSFKVREFEIVQNRAMRTILKCNRYVSISTMQKTLNMLSVRQMIMFDVYLFIFKMKRGLLPEYLCRKITTFSEVHSYSTRNCDDFIILRHCNTDQALNSPLYRGLLNYNQLPKCIKQCNTVRMFKVHLREHIVNMSAF